jgi:hypothetical protein
MCHKWPYQVTSYANEKETTSLLPRVVFVIGKETFDWNAPTSNNEVVEAELSKNIPTPTGRFVEVATFAKGKVTVGLSPPD